MQEDGNIEYAIKIQKQFASEIASSNITDKQGQAASVILAADKLITEWIFHDDKALTVKEIMPFLSTRDEVSSNERAYNYLLDFITINQNKFKDTNDFDSVWGAMDPQYIYIINAQFDDILYKGGYNPRAFLSWLNKTGKVYTGTDGKSTQTKRIKRQCQSVRVA